jgi:hypothetical protein
MSEKVLSKATQRDLDRHFVRKMKELDTQDADFSSKFDDIYNDYHTKRSVNARDNAGEKYSLQKYTLTNLFDSPFDFIFKSPLLSFSRLHDQINNFMTETRSDTKFDNTTLTKKPENLGEKEKSYYKYVSSFTTFDNTGKRQAKSISRVEKSDGTNRRITQITKTQDGNKYIEEHLNPNGTTKRIEKTLTDKQELLEKIEN